MNFMYLKLKSIDKNSYEVETKIKKNKVGQRGSKFSNLIMFIQINLCSLEALMAGIFCWLHISEALPQHTVRRLDKEVITCLNLN